MLLSSDELVTELRALGILTPDDAARASESGALDEDPATCAARLVESSLLTSYQSKRVLAGKGRRLVVGPYILLDRLGRGGMGRVYKARHRLMNRVVALKVVARSRNAKAVRRRFRLEVQAVGRLRHPGIVAAYDAGIVRGRPYLAMEYIAGIDLERVVRDSGPLSVQLACEVVRQTAEALHHAHECGLVHRDVKPSNLLLAPPGVTVKLLDLGLAAFADGSLSVERDGTSDPELCGTPDFMDPESAEGRRFDARGDLYSLGCTFYFLLTGRVPHPGGTWPEKLLRHCLDVPEPLELLRPDVPADVAAIVARLMDPRPEARYPTAEAVAAQLSLPSFPEPHSEPAVVSAEPAARKRRRSPRLLRGACIAVLLGIVAGAGARWIVKVARSAVPQSLAAEPDFQVEGRTGRFSTLAQAIASARDGDVVIVGGSGPFLTPPLNCQGKALTIRAREALRPRLVLKAGVDPWQGLFQSNRRLILEGLDLETKEAPARGSPPRTTPLVCCEGAPLRLSDCRLTSGGVAVVIRDAADVSIESCRIAAEDVGLSLQIGSAEECRVRLIDTRLSVRAESGAALSLWADELRQTPPVRLDLQGNTIAAGRMMALRTLPAGLSITARDNHFAFRTALLSYTRCRTRHAWRETAWQGGGNTYDGPASWLWVDDRPVSLPARTDLR